MGGKTLETHSLAGRITSLTMIALLLCLATGSAQTHLFPQSPYYMQPFTLDLKELLIPFGTPPYTYQLQSGTLPPGLALASSGLISGTPTTLGTYNFVVLVTDSSKPPKQKLVPTGLTVTIGTDIYGGFTAVPAAGGATGFFRMQKQKGRWILVSPLGNLFLLRSVYGADEGFIESGILQQRYNNDMDLWAQHRGKRMLYWGFNTLGEYTSGRGLPVGTWGDKGGNLVKLPFILFCNTAADLIYHPDQLGVAEPIKNIVDGIPQSTYNDYQGRLLDVFDPKWQQGYQGEMKLLNRFITDGFANVPWILGATTEDSDYFWALKGTGNNPVAAYPHPAWLVAVTNFQQTGYIDPQLYSKYAWVSYLQGKYGNIQALNTAWGSNYTTFGDSGGFGTGTGVLDEDGRHTQWIGKDYFNLSDTNPNLKADLDMFLYKFVYQLESVAVQTFRSYDKNHFIIGPTSLGGLGDFGVRPQVLQALADAGVDALTLGYDPLNPQNVSTVTAAYNFVGKPSLIWYGVTANQDSYWHGFDPGYHAPDYPTQVIRGQHYSTDMGILFNATANNGDYPILGTNFWALTDSGKAETTNWGLLSDKDNAYDGKCAIQAPSTDQWGFPCGGETADYGDFINAARQTNLNYAQQLILQQLH